MAKKRPSPKKAAKDVQTHGHPDVFLRLKFKTPDCGMRYSQYVGGYQDRKNATTNGEEITDPSELRKYGYMDNPAKRSAAGKQKYSALFDANHDEFTKEMKQAVLKLYDDAQDNGSPMWMPVFSFKNEFLVQQGYYNPATKTLDEDRLHNVIRASMKAMLDSEGMPNAIWTGDVHFNTDNIHVHVSVVEVHPTRKKFHNVRKDKEEYRAAIKPSTFKRMKSALVHEFIHHAETFTQLQELSRGKIIKDRPKNIFHKDPQLRALFLQIYHSLPKDKRLWHYNMNAIKDERLLLDQLSKIYVDRYHKEDMQAYLKGLHQQADVYRSVYGEGKEKGADAFIKNRINDLYARLGNSILNEMRQYDKECKTNKAKLRAEKWKAAGEKWKSARGWLRFISAQNYSLDKSLQSLKQAMRTDTEKWRAEMEYDRELDWKVQSDTPDIQSYGPNIF